MLFMIVTIAGEQRLFVDEGREETKIVHESALRLVTQVIQFTQTCNMGTKIESMVNCLKQRGQ